MSTIEPPLSSGPPSNTSIIESVLADIPLFCVGLTAIVVFAFFLFMKRVNLLAVYLYTSTLLAFGAALLDLSGILAATQSSSIGLSIPREVGLALSVGFTYLLLWTYVSQCPLGEKPVTNENRETRHDPKFHSHSASWERWGTVGVVLKWATLGLSISIPLLQIIWRIMGPGAQRTYGPVYVAESTIEIVTSALFILKLLLNISLSPLTPWWRPLRSHAAPILALLLSLTVGIGNTLLFAFSEKVLGRFLRAVELYVLIIFVLIITFYDLLPVTAVQEGQTSTVPASVPRGKPDQTTVPVLRAYARTPEITVVPRSFLRAHASRPSQASTVSQLSSWITRRGPRRPDSSGEQLWNQDRELGTASPTVELMDSPHRLEMMRDQQRTEEGIVMGGLTPPIGTQVMEQDQRSLAAVSFASYYGMDHNSHPSHLAATSVPNTSRYGADSPIYGLNGIVNPTQRREEVHLRAPSRNSLDELLRQQMELDKSIRALRLFARQSDDIPFSPPTPDIVSSTDNPPESTKPPLSNRTTSMSTNKPDSASARSEFSLSIFPEPPIVDTGPLSPGSIVAGRARRLPRTSRRPSFPSSPSQYGTVAARAGSAGTRYDVTSFIRNLTTSEPEPLPTYKMGSVLNGVESEFVTDTVATPQHSRPMITTPLPSAEPGSNPISGARSVPTRHDALPSQSLLQGRTMRALPQPGTVTAIGSRRREGLPAQPRLAISQPRPSLQDGKFTEAADAFERPRPLPL